MRSWVVAWRSPAQVQFPLHSMKLNRRQRGGSAGDGSSRRGWAWQASIGVAIFGASLWALVRDMPAINVLWYLPAWYGYLLTLDAILLCREGRSFLWHRRRELLAMLGWSVPFWFVFEAYNFVIENWYYVYVFRSLWVQALYGFVAYATVFPACFFHAELLRSLTRWDKIRWPGLTITVRKLRILAVMGSVCVLAPLFRPRECFALVWLAPILLPACINYRVGAPSLLRDLEAGRPGRLLRLLAGGLIAGLVWEMFNFWARCKWIYTVPGFEEWKLFEMPVAGFLGFPFLAVGAFSTYSLFSFYIRGGRHWEMEGPDQAEGAPQGSALKTISAAVIAVIFSAVVYYHVYHDTVKSRRPLLSEIPALETATRKTLRRNGIATPEELRNRIEAAGPVQLAARYNMDPDEVNQICHLINLGLHKGMGLKAAKALQEVGVATVEELSRWDPEALWQRLKTERPRMASRLSPAQIKVLVRAAKFWGRSKR